jgi:hypothetical protein
MSKLLLVTLLCGLVAGQALADDTNVPPSPILSGTINVVIADGQGIVALTDSMVTETFLNERGIRTSKQRAEPGQKLFRIDDHTVCTIAGFGSADTPSLPDFLNNASAIMGRYEDSLKNFPPLSVADKLELLETVFSHYLMGVANIRDSMSGEGDYYFESLIAGYDPDGTPEIGGLILRMVSRETKGRKVFFPVTQDRRVIPIPSDAAPVVLLAGKKEAAAQFLKNPIPWRIDDATAAYEDSISAGMPLSTEQMKAFAIILKQHTADIDEQVGGPNQIAVLSAGHVQPLEQPSFAPILLAGFRFQIFAMETVDRGLSRSKSLMYGISASPQSFGLYFKNSFTGVRQDLDSSYYSGNVFKECLLSYDGGRLEFEKSNQVIDSDLLIGPNARRDSPEVQRLLKDFRWRKVEGPNAPSKSNGAGSL